MTSIYKPLIKIFFITAIFSAGIALSAFTTVKNSYANSSVQSNQTVETNKHSKASLGIPKSTYEAKLQRDINRLVPGNKQFSPRFLDYILTNRKQQKEA